MFANVSVRVRAVRYVDRTDRRELVHMSKFESLDERSVFSGELGEVVQAVQPDGRLFERFRRPPGVRIVIVSAGKVLLTEEYRSETGGFDLRLPGGKVFDSAKSFAEARRTGRMSEAVKEAVAREALEEVGIIVSRPEPLIVAQAGATVEWDLHYFLVRDFTNAPDGPAPEKGEDITPKWLRPEDIYAAIRASRMSEWRSVGVLLGLVFPQEFPAFAPH
ncbi:NUDIX domain-containing protein [Nonomuraea sp. NPDC048892]|uniref:NUDIX hydrolase n=1 Tax=Nonomuraea sp. NPDC048892 TaxID=3154624 RepID=UPI00340D1CF8